MIKVYKIDTGTAEIAPVNTKHVLGVFRDNGTSRAVFEIHDKEFADFIRGYDIYILHASESESEPDVYKVEDVEETDYGMKFSWILDRLATSDAGVLRFAVQFKKDDLEWNTGIHKEKILDGLSMAPHTEEEVTTYGTD